ncbi:MAG: LysR family transcriptional regulator [Myxococcales bacterium]|nr:LysR family transcriptional regulator [Myxococcales bacterium]
MADWDDLRFVLALARHKTLSAAARELGVAQTTVGRRLDAFEATLGAPVFEREPSGFALTELGLSVRAHAERMEESVLAVARVVEGRDARAKGRVRISASEWLVQRALVPFAARACAALEAVELELVADARHVDLARREADIALRPRRFDHDAIYQRSVGRIAFGLYASRAYLARAPELRFDLACEGHAVLCMPEDVGDAARAWLQPLTARARIAARANGREALASLAARGLGLACLPRILGDAMDELVCVDTPTPAPTPVLRMGVHRDVRRAPRVAAVCALLDEHLRSLRLDARAT